MKYLLLACLIFTLSACTLDEKKELFFEKNTNTYSIVISTIENKVDENGHGQCDKYSHSNATDTAYYSYGMTAMNQIIDSYKSQVKYFTGNIESKYLVIEISNLSKDKINYQNIVRQSLKEAFKITIDSSMRQVDGYALTISESVKLATFRSAPDEDFSLRRSDFEFTGKKLSLSFLAKVYDSESKLITRYDGNDQNTYNIDFTLSNDIEKVKETFSKYGLTLTKTSFEMMFYEVKKANI